MKNFITKFYFFNIAIFTISIFLTSCQQEEILQLEESTTSEATLQTTIDHIQVYETADFVPHYFVSIGISPKAYRLDKQAPTTPDFVQLIKSTKKSNDIQPLKVVIDESGLFISNVIEANEKEETEWKESSDGKFWDGTNIAETEDIDPKELNENFTKNATLLFTNHQEIENVFDAANLFRCNPNGGNYNGCIPFNYKADGCYARAHRMKQIMELYYGRTCLKMLIYADVTNGKMLNVPGCDNGWFYHMAPLVRSHDSHEWYVLDPSLETEPVDRYTWMSKVGVENICQERYAYGSVYGSSWGCGTPYYYYDEDYTQTYKILDLYEKRSGCY